MQIRYYIDSATGLPHIYHHDVSEQEVEDILRRPLPETGLEGCHGIKIRNALEESPEDIVVKVLIDE